MTDVYRSLTVDFPDLAELIEARRQRGLDQHEGLVFAPSLKDTWVPDVDEELGDALIYLEAEITKADRLKRVSSEAYAKWITFMSARRKIADALWNIREACSLDPTIKKKRRR